MGKRVLVGLVAASALSLGAWAASTPPAGRLAGEAAATQPAPAEGVRRFRGLVAPSKQVVLFAPLGGVLQKLPRKEGETVKAGETVVEMDDGLQKVLVEEARLRAASDAEIRHAQLALEEAQIVLERKEEARQKDAASEWEVRQAKLQRDQAAAAVDAAKDAKTVALKRVTLEEEKLARYRVKAPFAGVVARRHLEEGATVTERDQIISLAALEQLEATIYISVEHYQRLQAGKDYPLEAAAPVGRTLTGKLKLVDPLIDSASQSVRCVFTLDNADLKLPAGFTVSIAMPR